MPTTFNGDVASASPAPLHLALAASTHAPVLPLLREPAAPMTFDAAKAALQEISKSMSPERTLQTLLRAESAVAHAWTSSVSTGDIDRFHIEAFAKLCLIRGS